MVTVGKMAAQIDIPPNYVGEYLGELVASSLRACGWTQLQYNDQIQEITAEQKKTMRKAGESWQLNFGVLVQWEELSSTTKRLKIDVQDRESRTNQRDLQQLAYDIIKGVVERGTKVKSSMSKPKERTTYGSSRWATFEELEARGFISTLDDWDHGNRLILAPGQNGKRLTITEEDTARHAMVCGPTGCGKSSSIFKPNLFERTKVSAIVTEATPGNNPPDLYTTTSGFRQQQGHDIYYFNPDDMASIRINPLDAVTTISKAQEIADLIMDNTIMTKNSGGDAIWPTSERHLLTALLMHFAPEKQDLAAVRSLVREGAAGVGKVLENSRVSEAAKEYQAFMNISTEGFRNGVLAGVLQRLRLWVNPRVVALTQKTDHDISTMSQSLFTFYLAVPAEKEFLKPVAALVLNFILNHVVLATDPKNTKYPLALFLDEFTNFGMIPGIARNLTLFRHRKTPIMFGCQDYTQLKEVYGDTAKQFFSQPGTRVIFRTRDKDTCREVSEALGKETAVERKLLTNCSVSEREFAKDLMSPSDIQSLDSQMSVFLMPDGDPIKLERFSWKNYEEQLKIPPPERRPEMQVDDSLIKYCGDQEAKPNWEEDWESQQKSKGQTGKTAAKPKEQEIKEEVKPAPPPAPPAPPPPEEDDDMIPI